MFTSYSGVGTDDPKVTCPICGCPFVHIASVAVNEDGRVTTTENGGVRINYKGERGQRGAIVSIDYDGECGHRFEERRTFHKGEVLTASVVPAHHDAAPERDELWRN